jgi:hypothetical protein
MRALWIGLEKLDQALMTSARRIESWSKAEPFRVRMEESVEEVRLPQKVIQFDA